MRGVGVFGAVLAVIGLVAVFAFFGAFYTIDAGERGVVLRNGRVTGVADAGLHFKLPFVDDVYKISTRTFTVPYENEPFYSKDQQAATATVSITFSAVPGEVQRIYTQYGDLDTVAARLLTPRVKKEFKEVMGKFNAAQAIQEREKLSIEVANAITSDITGVILIESVQVENIDFSNAYEEAIEQRMLAEVAIAKVRQDAERAKATAEITVTEAQAKADSLLAQRTAEAEGIRRIGEAEAEAINAKGKALRDNPALVSLVAAERWNGTLPSTMVPNGAVPFLDVGKTSPVLPLEK